MATEIKTVTKTDKTAQIDYVRDENSMIVNRFTRSRRKIFRSASGASLVKFKGKFYALKTKTRWGYTVHLGKPYKWPTRARAIDASGPTKAFRKAKRVAMLSLSLEQRQILGLNF